MVGEMKKTILLIEDDAKVEAKIKDILNEYGVEAAAKPEAAAEYLSKNKPDLVILDLDLKGHDGLQLFRQMHSLVPQAKIIILSASNDIPLSVSATKLGAADFLRKPIVAEQLLASVRGSISAGEEIIVHPARAGWLQGESQGLREMYSGIRRALPAFNNLILFGERGIEKKDVVEFIHANSLKRKRKLQVLDLSSFRRENLETYFWVTVRELMMEPEIGSVQNEEDRVGTLYLENIEDLEESFKLSVFDFFKERKGKVDREILAIIGVYDKIEVKGYVPVGIPPLRERRDDLPYLISHYLKLYARKHNRPVRGISADLLNFLAAYDFPGNFRELECLIEGAVLLTHSEVLEPMDVPQDIKALTEVAIKKALRGGKGLEEATREFEGNLYDLLLSKTGGDVAAAARFLDVPRTVVAERIDELRGNLSD